MQVRADMLVDEVMRRWPATIKTFLNWRFQCVGCPFGVFHTIEDACAEHEADQQDFLAAVERAAAGLDESLNPAAAPQEAPIGAGP